MNKEEMVKIITGRLNELLVTEVTPGQHASALSKTAEFYRMLIKRLIEKP